MPSGSRRSAAYAPSGLARINENEDNRGLGRYETDHVPEATGQPTKKASQKNKGLERYQTDHPLKATVVPGKRESKRESKRETLAPEQYTVNPSHKPSTRIDPATMRPRLSRLGSTKVSDLTRATSRHSSHGSSRAPPASPSRHAGNETYGNTRAIASARPRSGNYGPTSLTVHQEVTRAPRYTADEEFLFAALKAKYGRGMNDPRSLDEVVRGKYFEGQDLREWVLEELGVSPRDRRPLEDLFHEANERGLTLSSGGGRRTLKRRDSFSSSEDDWDAWSDEEDRNLGRSLRTVMPRGTGKGKKKGRVSRMMTALATHVRRHM